VHCNETGIGMLSNHFVSALPDVKTKQTLRRGMQPNYAQQSCEELTLELSETSITPGPNPSMS
jgi:hypothetical protein